MSYQLSNRELCGETLPPDRHVKASLPLVRCSEGGFVLPESFVMSGLLERVAEFETREDDVIVAGFPRSGMAWRRSLATSQQMF